MRILLLVTIFLASLNAQAQGGSPVFIVPSWDELFPVRLPEIPEMPVDGKLAAAQGVKEIVMLDAAKQKKKKKRKKNTDTLAIWRLDRDGRVIAFNDRRDGFSTITISYVHRDKIGAWSKRSAGGLDSFNIRYNRSGVPDRVIRTHPEAAGAGQTLRSDTFNIHYASKLFPVIYKDAAQKETHAYLHDPGGRLLKRTLTRENEGLISVDSISYSKENGSLRAEHYYRSYVADPPAYQLIDKLLLDSLGNVLEYEYVFAQGNGNLRRNVQRGEIEKYTYANGLPVSGTLERGTRTIENRRYDRDRHGTVTTYHLQKTDWSVKGEMKPMIHYITERTYDKNGMPEKESYRVFKRYGTSSVEDPKAARYATFVLKK